MWQNYGVAMKRARLSVRERCARHNRPMTPADKATPVRWYRSFYFRIGFSFVIFVVGLLVAQSLIFNVILTRPPFPVRSPNNLVAIIAADLGSALTQDPALDLGAYLEREYARLQPIHVLMKSGDTAANRPGSSATIFAGRSKRSWPARTSGRTGSSRRSPRRS